MIFYHGRLFVCIRYGPLTVFPGATVHQCPPQRTRPCLMEAHWALPQAWKMGHTGLCYIDPLTHLTHEKLCTCFTALFQPPSLFGGPTTDTELTKYIKHVESYVIVVVVVVVVVGKSWQKCQINYLVVGTHRVSA